MQNHQHKSTPVPVTTLDKKVIDKIKAAKEKAVNDKKIILK